MAEESKETIHLHFSDLKLLMENYQNVVQLNTLLLEQQKQILDLQKELKNSQYSTSENQSKIFDKIENIIKSIESQSGSFQQTNSLVTNLDSALHNRFNSSDSKTEETKVAISSMNLDLTKQHSGIVNKLYVALVGSGLIILSLVGLLITTYEKLGIINHIHELVEKIVVILK